MKHLKNICNRPSLLSFRYRYLLCTRNKNRGRRENIKMQQIYFEIKSILELTFAQSKKENYYYFIMIIFMLLPDNAVNEL